jgi:hypothetical protein
MLVIMTRSRTKTSTGLFLTLLCALVDVFSFAVPHEFTSIPFPVKALKILVHDLRSGGESAAINSHGEEFDAESDDGVSFSGYPFASKHV